MKKTLGALLIGGSVLLSGCVISVGGDGVDGYHSDWQKTERDNREAIANFAIGMSEKDVKRRLGTPDFSERMVKQQDEYQILYYRTQRQHDDGITTKDECTPLIIKNGELVGWGDAVMASL
ncbi:DUF3192 domain-containing protein [Aestuariibacter salexigens]|uniref:DUF3192 domain-containing protein n=1 Tax=Aestuariibacter salexigens TaxID=226010 RepID=UPI0003FA5380|nr:DUF3192 domain-containing protein [Aestuariibacter salexigens]